MPNLPNFHFRSSRTGNHKLNLDLENSSALRFWYFSVVEKHHSFQKWGFVKTCQKQFSHCHLVLLQLTKQYWIIDLLSLLISSIFIDKLKLSYWTRSSVISQQMGFLEKFHSKLEKFHSNLENFHSKLENFHSKLEKFHSELRKFHSNFVKIIRLFSNP